jgi:LPS sulfotransferase NodH
LLTSSGVAGRPESYFREPDQHAWAERFGVPVADDGSFDYRAFTAAALRAGTTPNGVFAARIMWGTMGPVVEGLDQGRPRLRDLDVLVDAFGPLQLVHLRREDVVGQAVSWARAEQTGYWHRGDSAAAGEPRLDLNQINALVSTIHDHNAAWDSWFAAQDVNPLVVTYEHLVADPRKAVHRVLRSVGESPPPGWRPASSHERQADEVNANWVRRYHVAYG